MFEDLYSEGLTCNRELGQVLTPAVIVDYMVKESISKAWENHDKTQPLKILDPACGTGRFMLGVADYCVKENIPFIIYNVDIDPQMYVATIRNAVHYKLPAVVVLGNALLNDFERAVFVEDGEVKELPVEEIIYMFKKLSENGKVKEPEKKRRVKKRTNNELGH